jgi:hypothetical protein
VSAGLPFFSDAWCAEALTAANACDEFQQGLVEPDSFNATITFVCTDRDDLASRVEFTAGQATRWTSGTSNDDSGAWLRAPLQVWCAAGEGEAELSRLLVGRGVKLRDTRRKAIASNYRALDALVASWALIPTNWEI